MDDTINNNQQQSKESQGQLKGSLPKEANFRPWLFKKGQSGNPGGMKKGTVSLKTWAKKYLQELTDEEKLEFIDGLPKDIIWRMSEGQPHQTQETEVKGKVSVEFASEFNTKKDEIESTPETKPDNKVASQIQGDKGRPQGREDKV